MRGKLIVIDGTDGAGKATQTKLLAKRLRQSGKMVLVQDFPRYGKKSAALVEDYLNGRFGPALKLGPRIPSIFYAVDRFAASKDIHKALSRGQNVISNRYVSANLGHQGSKLKTREARRQFFAWANELEYRLFNIPKPDLTLVLHLPSLMAQRLVEKKSARGYLKRFKKKDLHERDISHLLAAEKTYLELCELFKFRLIKCFNKTEILAKDEIAELIWKEVKKIL